MTQVVLESLLHYVTEDDRVCPKPQIWNELWELLPNRNSQGAGWNPPLPLILGAWHETTDEEKIARLALHIRHAYENGEVSVLDKFIRSLNEDAWVHRGDV